MRRVVTGHDKNGKSIFVSDGETSRIATLDEFPGVRLLDEIWATDETPSIPVDTNDPTLEIDSLVPSPGGTRFRFFTVLPEEDWRRLQEQGKDVASVMEKFLSVAPGFGGAMEMEDPGMHTTDTIDYGIVLSGEVYLELDDGEEVFLKQGDTFVQNGTRHAWRNRGKEPFVGTVVMIGAKRR